MKAYELGLERVPRFFCETSIAPSCLCSGLMEGSFLLTAWRMIAPQPVSMKVTATSDNVRLLLKDKLTSIFTNLHRSGIALRSASQRSVLFLSCSERQQTKVRPVDPASHARYSSTDAYGAQYLPDLWIRLTMSPNSLADLSRIGKASSRGGFLNADLVLLMCHEL